MRAALLLLVVATTSARADVSVERATPATLPTVALVGPYASLEAICALKENEKPYKRECAISARSEHAAAITVTDRRDFDGRADGFIAIRTERGWFVDEDLADFTSNEQQYLLHDNMRYSFAITGVDERASGIVLRAVHAIFFQHGLPDYCVGLEVHCPLPSVGATPYCAKPLVVAGSSSCGRPAPRHPRWEWTRRPERAANEVVIVPPMPRLGLPRALRRPMLSSLPAELSAPPAGRYALRPPAR